MNKVVTDYIKELGYENVIDINHEELVDKWLMWYKGRTPQHTYYIYNGKTKNKYEMKSLNIASQSCGDISDFYFNEKLDITIDKEDIQETIKKILMQNNFLYNCNNLMQLTEALGTGAIVPYLDNDKLRINYIAAPNIVILSCRENIPTEVLFFSEEKTKDGTEITINTHLLDDNDNYVIHNKKYLVDSNNNASEMEVDEKIKEIHTESPLPKFGLLKTSIVNNLDINSPYGISIYANAIDNILSIDRVFDSLDNEIALGRKRVYVSGDAASFNTDENGKITPIFDTTDVAFYQIPGKEGQEPIKESSFDLRIEQLSSALQYQLNMWTSKIGLGHNYYKFKDGQTYVNTDNVISSNSDVYRKIKKQENIITNCLINVIYAIAELIGLSQEFEISIDYDDSIIEDKEQIRKQAQTEYNTGLISKAQYYRDVYKLNDSTAVDFMEQMNKEIKEGTIVEGEEETFIE